VAAKGGRENPMVEKPFRKEIHSEFIKELGRY